MLSIVSRASLKSFRFAPVDRVSQEVAQHLLGHLEVGDHTVAERPARSDRRRGPADHPLRLRPDRDYRVAALVDRDHRRLEQDDPLPAQVHDRVRGAEVDRQLAAAPPQVAQKTHAESMPEPPPAEFLSRRRCRTSRAPSDEAAARAQEPTETATTATAESPPPKHNTASPPDAITSPTKLQGPLERTGGAPLRCESGRPCRLSR
jgi:hypothetical protein